MNFSRSKKTVQIGGAWIGLYGKADNGFYWVDDTPVTGQFSAWRNGEPDEVQDGNVPTYMPSGTHQEIGMTRNAVCLM